METPNNFAEQSTEAEIESPQITQKKRNPKRRRRFSPATKGPYKRCSKMGKADLRKKN